MSNTTEIMENSTTMMTSLLNSTTAAMVEQEEHILEKVARGLNVYLLAFIVFGGCFVNGLTVLVLNKKGVAHSSVCVYLSTLAISDSIVLIGDWLNNWFRGAFNIYLIGHTDFVCRLYRYLFPVCYMYSAWLVVALAFERFMAIVFPFVHKKFSSAKQAVLTVILILVVDLICMTYQIFVNQRSDEGWCDWHPNFIDFHMTVNGWLVGFLYSYIPFILLVVFNLGMIICLVKAANRRDKMTGNDGGNTELHRITLTVVTLCIFYLILTTPLALFYLILYNLGMWTEPTPIFALGESIIINLALVNHAINFFLYVMTSRSFRKDLGKLLCCHKRADKYVDGKKSSSGATNSTAVSASKMEMESKSNVNEESQPAA